jgi:hypothetical protein
MDTLYNYGFKFHFPFYTYILKVIIMYVDYISDEAHNRIKRTC